MQTKNFLQSKTLWGAFIMAAPTVAQLVGINLTTEDAREISSLVETGAQVVGGAMVVYGRIKATSNIKFLGG